MKYKLQASSVLCSLYFSLTSGARLASLSHEALYPGKLIGDPGVDPGAGLQGTANPPAHHSYQAVVLASSDSVTT